MRFHIKRSSYHHFACTMLTMPTIPIYNYRYAYYPCTMSVPCLYYACTMPIYNYPAEMAKLDKAKNVGAQSRFL